MKKKILLGISIGFLAVLILVFVVAGFFLGDFVKKGINTFGPKVTQTVVSVDSVGVRPLLGSVSLNNFILGNPQEYLAKATNAITVGNVAISVAPMSVMSDKIVVKDLELRDAEIFFEGNPLPGGSNNLKKIQDNVNAFVGSTGKPAGTNAPAAEKPAKKLEVDNILITGAKVHFNGVALPLPDIHLTNLGTGPDGITPAELFRDILSEISVGTIKAIGSSAGSAGKAIGDEANKAVKSIGDLFKKK
jgi:uncharacterized protein involved in outer membrane biogenesis